MRAGERVRITVQLIDAATGAHVWAERFDRRYEDIFDLQDEITRTIVAIIPGRVEATEVAKRKRPTDLAAYDYVMRAKILHHTCRGPADNQEAQRLLNEAVALDPDYAHAHAWRGCVMGQAFVRGYEKVEDGILDRVRGALERAYGLDENDSEVHRILAALNLVQRNFDKVEYHQERGLALNSNYDLIVVQQGELLTWLGRGEEAIGWIERAMRLNPYHPERFWGHLGRALYVAGRYAEAIKAFERIAAADFATKAALAACHAELGHESEAQGFAAATLALSPQFSTASFVATLPFKEDRDRERVAASLAKAGLPA
jgi:adenylate cyclase